MGKEIWMGKKKILDFFKEGQKGHFLIPDYQREYSWDADQVERLFDDLTEFSSENKKSEKQINPYFLGSIVYYNNGKKKEIIDGQQRLTTMTLFLRALYENMVTETNDSAESLKKEIQLTLWEEINDINHTVNKSKTLIETKVATDDDIEEFNNIMKNGIAKDKAKDNYNRNYGLLVDKINKYFSNKHLIFYDFIRDILDNVIFLPIEAENYDSALRIFNTLNDRGLPLCDADIFKAEIYKKLSKNEKKEFIEKWKELNKKAKRLGKDDLTSYFYYEMFYHRALFGDKDTTTPKLRDYYIKKNIKKLHDKNIMSDIEKIIDFELFVEKRDKEYIKNNKWIKNKELCNLLDILSCFNIEFSKYPPIIYYLKYHKKKGFDKKYIKFLKKYIALLIVKYLPVPSINSIKDSVLKIDAAIIDSMEPKIDKMTRIDNICDSIYNPPTKMEAMLLAILAYQKQKDMLPLKWEVEHILPRHWKDVLDPGNLTHAEVDDYCDHLGNKIPLEKKLNIKASNNWLTRKKKEYKKSNIVIAKTMAKYNKREFNIDSIDERDSDIKSDLISIIKKWCK